MSFTIDIDYEMADKIVYKSLKDSRDAFLKDLGSSSNVFVYGDPEADDAVIQKHIDALNLLLEWYRIPGEE
jgi:hypothetical protein